MLLNYQTFSTFVFDLDSAVWRLSELRANAKNVIDKLASKHKKIYFISNNTLLSRNELRDKLSEFGIKIPKESIINAGYSAARFLEEAGADNAYVIGEHGLIKEFEERKIGISSTSKHVVVSVDRNFTYNKLKTAADLINHGATFYCTGISRYFEAGDEKFPAEAPIIKAVEILTGKIPKLLGMPGDVIKQRFFEDVFMFPEDVVFIGGDHEIDVAFSRRCGFKCVVLPENGEALAEIKALPAEKKPDVILSTLLELIRE
ncbi:MAG: hypothetical protein KAT83_04060 [Candidatus Aenigmarchaeota archaeon]|nr:hypothetical protein [Candidatus Aenigmarchaeota archaeon]